MASRSIRRASGNRARLHLLDELRSDIRYAVRGLRRNPVYSFAAIAVLAIGIGLNTGVFTLANGALFKGFRFVRDKPADNGKEPVV